MNEKELISGCIKGERIAQNQLYDLFASKMKGICMRYCRTNFEADDIFQDAFIKIFKNIHKHQQEKSLEYWIRRIVINTAIDYYHKNLRFNNYLSFDDAPEKDLNIVELLDGFFTEELLDILKNLPDGYRIVFNLFAIDGYSHEEISQLLKISVGTSKSQLSKARKAIQQLYLKYTSLPHERARGKSGN